MLLIREYIVKYKTYICIIGSWAGWLSNYELNNSICNILIAISITCELLMNYT